MKNTDDKPVVDLSNVKGDICGVIIPQDSGIVFCNCVGGSACEYPNLEGVFVPLPFSSFELGNLADACIVDEDEEEAEDGKVDLLIEDFLRDNGLDQYFKSYTEIEYYNERIFLAEAWVPVLIRNLEDLKDDKIKPILKDLVGKLVILTWCFDE